MNAVIKDSSSVDAIVEMNDSINGLATIVNVLRKRVALLEDNGVSKYLLSSKDDAFLVHQKYKCILHKHMVLTEVRQILINDREEMFLVLNGLTIAFDLSDDWWIRKEEMPLYSWIELGMKINKMFGFDLSDHDLRAAYVEAEKL